MPKVSVIVPIHKVQDYLPHALNSLQEQTLADSEFICVNNNTVDNSLEISKERASKDKRFVVLDYGKIGIGRARNEGLNLAKGEYIAFLDPDDTLEKDSLERLYNQSKEQGTDILVFNYRKMNDKYSYVDSFGNPLGEGNMKKNMEGVYDLSPRITFNWRAIKPKLFDGFFEASWNKFYRGDFLHSNNLRFTENCNRCEDCAFVVGALVNADKIGYNDNFFYNYMIKRKGSASSMPIFKDAKITEDKPKQSDENLSIFIVLDTIKKVLIKRGIFGELKNEFDKYCAKLLCGSYKRVAQNDKDIFKKMCTEKLSDTQIATFLERARQENLDIKA